jgi:TP901 family phage tail tape measure protein
LTGSSEHIIKISTHVDSSNELSKNFDVTKITNEISSSLNSYTQSLEASILNAIKSALSNVNSKISSEDIHTFATTVSKEIRQAFVEKTNTKIDQGTLVDSKGAQKEVVTIIKSTLSDHLQTFLKSNNVEKAKSASNSVIKGVSTDISKTDMAVILKIATELSLFNKEFSSLLDITKTLANQEKRSPEKTTEIRQAVVNKAAQTDNIHKSLNRSLKGISNDSINNAGEELSSTLASTVKAAIKTLKNDFNIVPTIDIKKFKEELASAVKEEAVVKVSADVSKAEKDIEGLNKQSTNVVVTADTSKASTQIDKLLEQDILKLSIDLERDSIPLIYKRVAALIEKINELNANGINVGTDTKPLEDLLNKMTSVVRGYDYVKSSLGKNEHHNAKTELAHLRSADTSTLSERQRNNVESRIKELEVIIRDLGRTLNEMGRVVDRKPKAFTSEQNPIHSDTLEITRDFRRLQTVPAIKKSLEQHEETTDKYITNKGSIVRRESTLKELATLAPLVDEVNTIINKVAKNNIPLPPKSTTRPPAPTPPPTTRPTTTSSSKSQQAAVEEYKQAQKDAASKNSGSISNLANTLNIRYGEKYIEPNKVYNTPSSNPNEAELKVYDNMNRISQSLDALQANMYKKVTEGLLPKDGKKQYKEWKVVENEGTGPAHNRAFDLRGRDWAMDIVDMTKLQGLTGDKKGTPKTLLTAYEKKLSETLIPKESSAMKTGIADWLQTNVGAGGVGGLSKDVKSTLGSTILDQLNLPALEIKKSSLDDIAKIFDNATDDELKKIYTKTAGFSKIQEKLGEVKRTVAIPAAKVTNTGDTVLETRHGSQRSTLQVAQYTSGHERAFESYINNIGSLIKKTPVDKQHQIKEVVTPEILSLAKAARTIGPNTKEKEQVPGAKISYEDASRLLLKADAGKDGAAPTREAVLDRYKKALVPISIERQRISSGTSKEVTAKEVLGDLNSKLESAFSSSKSIDEFMSTMELMSVSATKVLRSLDSLDFSDVYKNINTAIQPDLTKIVNNIATSSGAIGDLEKTLGTLEGIMPIVDYSSPRRGMHQGSTVATITNSSKAYSLPGVSDLLTDEGKGTFLKNVTDEQLAFNQDNEAKKSFITSFNRRTRELFYEAEHLQDPKLFEGHTSEVDYRKSLVDTQGNKQLTSLGLTESTASALGDTPYAMGRGGRILPMYTGNLREMSPFGLEYQQTGRNISGISSAKTFDTDLFPEAAKIQAEMPRLRSESEDKVIQAGRFGKSGIGYNVLAELRHTAGTFEDQILVSGKLADAATTAVKKLVRPKATAGKASAINEGPLKDAAIEEASGHIMTLLGVDEKSKRRPDKAFIDNVRNEISNDRGSSLEVQTARLAELFLNHFGRKLTTRFGSKGVSVTPTNSSTLGDIISANKGHSVKVMTKEQQEKAGLGGKAGLGVAYMPKSMGELSADIINQQDDKTKAKISKDTSTDIDTLTRELQESGNKFILDIFNDVEKGLVTEAEAIKNKATFEKAKKAFAALGKTLTTNLEGINTIKDSHTGDKVTPKAIDVRISSYGAAKRGLQTEPLEIIANNLASSTDSSTVIKNTIKDTKHGLIAGGESGGLFSKYSKALGFSGAEGSETDLREKISSMYSADKLKEKEVQDAITAMVELEKKSNYYVEVIDELNNKRKSLVGEKFLSIVKDPVQTEEWSTGSIESLSKGLKLNVPAYAAYASVFGDESAFMKSLNTTFTDKQAEHYDNILTYLVSTNEEYKKGVLASVASVDIKDLKAVNKDAVKTFDEGDPGSLIGTIFDTDKYPTALKTVLPSTKDKDAPGEELYIPRSISRTTYADPLRAGAYGIKGLGSDLQDVIDKSRSLSAFYKKDPELLLDTDVTGMAGAFGSTAGSAVNRFFERDSAGSLTGYENEYKEGDPEKESLEKTKLGFLRLLKSFSDKGVLSKEAGSLNPEIVKFYNKSANTNAAFNEKDASETSFVEHLRTTEGFNSPTSLHAMKNMLVGFNNRDSSGPDTSILGKATDRGTRLELMQGVSEAIGDKDRYFSYGTGKNKEEKYEGQVQRRQISLEKTKSNYQDNLRKTLSGKKGSVARTFFTRNIPSVLAEAVNATVDKTEDLEAFSSALKSIDESGFSDQIKKIQELISEHSENVSKYKKLGVPVLKQHELGISGKMAEKLKVDFVKKYDENTALPTDHKEVSSNLADLLEYKDKLTTSSKRLKNKNNKAGIDSYIKEELSPYVESIRFPITGTSSIKPYEAKLMQTKDGIGDDAFIVPGAPEMDMAKFEEVYESLKASIKEKSAEREAARVSGDDAKADSLTTTIDRLNDALTAVLPKYVAHAQKLDFDGDQLEIHTAKTKEARQDIYKHFKMLTEDSDSTAGRFGDYYSYDAKQPSQGDLPLSFMAKAFSKKFDSTKGYSFLEKPFTTEDLSYLSPKEKVGILASKEQDLNGLSGGEAVSRVMSSAFVKAGQKFDSKSVRGIKDLGEAANIAATSLDNPQLGDSKSLIEGYLKEELAGLKLDTAINAQLFKINTGTDVESMTKLMRAYEDKIGYDGSGEVGYAAKDDSHQIDQDFVVRERNTQLNEFFRFALQKGMDVKHAGERPISGELVKGVTTGPTGLANLFRNLENNKSYGDLKDFRKINEESLRNRFSRLSTNELKEQVSNNGISQKDVSGMDREELVNNLVSKLGFDGFLRDLQATIEQLALNGIQQTQGVTKEEALDKLQKSYRSVNGAAPRGINVSGLVTNVMDPLYKFRTDGFKVDETFDDKFSDALASIQDTEKRTGAYPELVRSFASLNKENVDKTQLEELSNLFSNTPKEDFATGKISMKPLKSMISSMENVLGLAPVSDRKEATILTSPEHVATLKDYSEIKDEKERNKVIRENERLDKLALLKNRFERISSAAQFTLPEAGNVVFPKTSNPNADIERATGAAKSSSSNISWVDLNEVPNESKTSSDQNVPGGNFSQPPNINNVASSAAPSGGPLPVYLVGMDAGLTFPVKFIGQVITSANISEDSHGAPKDQGSDIGNMTQTVEGFKTTEEQRKNAAARAHSLEPFEGTGPSIELANLDLLRNSSKSLYQERGMDFKDEIKKLPEEAQGFIENAKGVGALDVTKFLEYTKNASLLNKQDATQGMQGKHVADAWRLYKDSVIEYLMTKAKDAEASYEKVRGTGGREEAQAFNKFASSVKVVQNRIKNDIGKRSDIYTSNKVFAFPEIAKAAGVYQSPLDIQRKSNRDLGDPADDKDPESLLLTNVFDNITKDLSGKSRGEIKSPTEKARNAIKDLTDMDQKTVDLMQNGKLLERLGPEISNAWDFKGAAERLTRLRSALELFKQFNVSDSPLSVEKKNLEETIKLLKDAENKLSRADMGRKQQVGAAGVWGDNGVIQVPKWADPKMQSDMHQRNISKLRQYYGTAEEKGGAKIGERYAYDAKVFDDAGRPLENQRTLFHKFSETVDSAGQTIGLFSAKQEDLAASLAGANRGFLGAIERAIKWGAASTLIYGGVSQLKEAVDTVALIETNMAQLKMVMPSVGTDFEGMQQSATGMAKKYGAPTTDVLDAMVVYAQQGLSQADVLERTNTSMLAANVTTLKAKEATEALTAAMKIFREEGDNSMRFLDSWSEVEAKHAITSGDMAQAIMKAAAAASTAGINFDQLNGIVAAIGSVTRQSGKEVGTSLRFIMRRLSAEKGPDYLAKLNIPTITGAGELRGGFDILSELAMKWKELNSAQKMAVAQAIGGTRQYNSLLVLMDNWQEALDGVHHSMNAQGSATRRNVEIMQTYSKQVEQTKAAFVELQASFGKIAFPVAKFGLQGMKALAETISGIPTAFKVASVAALGLFTYLSQGAKILENISDFFSGGAPIFGGLVTSIKDELKTASFEVLGAGSLDDSSKGLKTVIAGAASGRERGKGIRDFESGLGKLAYLVVSAGKTFNDTVGEGLQTTGKAGQSFGQATVRGSSWLSGIVSSLGGGKYGKSDEDITYKDLAGGVASKFAKSEGIKGASLQVV